MDGPTGRTDRSFSRSLVVREQRNNGTFLLTGGGRAATATAAVPQNWSRGGGSRSSCQRLHRLPSPSIYLSRPPPDIYSRCVGRSAKKC